MPASSLQDQQLTRLVSVGLFSDLAGMRVSKASELSGKADRIGSVDKRARNLTCRYASWQRPHFGIMPVIKDQITALRRHNA